MTSACVLMSCTHNIKCTSGTAHSREYQIIVHMLPCHAAKHMVLSLTCELKYTNNVPRVSDYNYSAFKSVATYIQCSSCRVCSALCTVHPLLGPFGILLSKIYKYYNVIMVLILAATLLTIVGISTLIYI